MVLQGGGGVGGRGGAEEEEVEEMGDYFGDAWRFFDALGGWKLTFEDASALKMSWGFF